MSLPSRLDSLLSNAVQSGALPCLYGVVGNREGALYARGFGPRATGTDAVMDADTVVWLASTTKAITATGVMQLVEQGRLQLDAPAAEIMPALRDTQVLTGFDAQGQPQLRAPARPITLRHLLTHSVGFGYEFSNADLARYMQIKNTPSILGCFRGALDVPLLFDPGTRWEYGTGIDWGGLMLEKITGLTLGHYLREHLFAPLGMNSTGFSLTPEMRGRLSGFHARTPDGKLAGMPFEMPAAPEFEMGGGALYGTGEDYLRFMRMILNGGALDGRRVLREDTVREMLRDQCPTLACGVVNSINPALSNQATFFPPEECGWGLSFMLNRKAVPGGRKAGTVTWAGLSNVYYWIDPASGICAMLGTQLLPFFDTPMVDTLVAFEREVYAA